MVRINSKFKLVDRYDILIDAFEEDGKYYIIEARGKLNSALGGYEDGRITTLSSDGRLVSEDNLPVGVSSMRKEKIGRIPVITSSGEIVCEGKTTGGF